jgi:hypothetical protein
MVSVNEFRFTGIRHIGQGQTQLGVFELANQAGAKGKLRSEIRSKK